MGNTCDTRYWVIQFLGDYPIVALTTDDPTEAGVAKGYLNGELIDRIKDPLPPFRAKPVLAY